MSDIIRQLKTMEFRYTSSLRLDAADEIVALRADNERLREQLAAANERAGKLNRQLVELQDVIDSRDTAAGFEEVPALSPEARQAFRAAVQEIDGVNLREVERVRKEHSECIDYYEAKLVEVERLRNGGCARDNERLRSAGTALYMAGRWSCNIPANEQARLWEELRDALGLPEGTETKRAADSESTCQPTSVAGCTGCAPWIVNGKLQHEPDCTADSASAVQPERCCLDYPRCDCNSPPEPDNAPTLQPCGHPWKAQHDFKCILCSSPGDATSAQLAEEQRFLHGAPGCIAQEASP